MIIRMLIAITTSCCFVACTNYTTRPCGAAPDAAITQCNSIEALSAVLALDSADNTVIASGTEPLIIYLGGFGSSAK